MSSIVLHTDDDNMAGMQTSGAGAACAIYFRVLK
jgi:hypothetical protein